MDRKKYIVEASDDVKKVIALGVTHGGAIWTDTTDIENLEELNSDYINENFGDLQDTAYKKGLHDGESKCGYCNEYQRGLNDAWEAARKIVCDDELDWNTLLHIFNRGNFEGIFGDFSPSEAIAKLKAYEEKQKADDEIKVGDEVVWTEGEDVVIVVTRVYIVNNIEWCDGVSRDGKVYQILTEHARKTGRHFDIDKLLEAMNE